MPLGAKCRESPALGSAGFSCPLFDSTVIWIDLGRGFIVLNREVKIAFLEMRVAAPEMWS